MSDACTAVEPHPIVRFLMSYMTPAQRAACLADLARMNAVASAGLSSPPPQPSPMKGEGEDARPADDFVIRARRKEGAARGYTGDACDQCGAFKVKRNGTCTVCDDCGATTGCS